MAAIVFKDKGWRSLIRTIDKNVSNPKPLLRVAFGVRGFRDIIQHFQSEKGPKAKWKKSKRAKREGGRTLQDTGNLRQNFTPTNIDDSGKDKIIFFNPTPYASQHDLGDPGRNLPKREFMYLTDRAQEDMLNIILDRLVT